MFDPSCQTDSITVVENFITNNWTVAINLSESPLVLPKSMAVQHHAGGGQSNDLMLCHVIVGSKEARIVELGASSSVGDLTHLTQE